MAFTAGFGNDSTGKYVKGFLYSDISGLTVATIAYRYNRKSAGVNSAVTETNGAKLNGVPVVYHYNNNVMYAQEKASNYITGPTSTATGWLNLLTTYNGGNANNERFKIFFNGDLSAPNVTGTIGTVLGTLTNQPVSIGQYFNTGCTDDYAEVAVWSAPLTADEAVSYAKGFKPSRIRPQSLVFYAPLVRAVQDVRKGITLTPVNSPTVADHPRRYGK